MMGKVEKPPQFERRKRHHFVEYDAGECALKRNGRSTRFLTI